jgi:hypothetical protein
MSASVYQPQSKQSDVLNAIVLGMCIAPLILGNPFFEKAAWGDTTGTSFPGRQCAVASRETTENKMVCVNVGKNAVECHGTVRVYLQTWSCSRPGPGIRCTAISFPGNYVEYAADGATISGASTGEIAKCLGWDAGTISCILSLVSLIGGVLLTTTSAGASVVLIRIGAAGTLIGCAATAYTIFCNSGCCFMKCLPGRGESIGVRPWC